MLRIHFVQLWFNLSDPGMEDEIYEHASIRRFLEIAPLTNTIPDESTILRFRHLLEKHGLGAVPLLMLRSSPPEFDQEQSEETRPRDEFHKERKPVVFWHETPYWR